MKRTKLVESSLGIKTTEKFARRMDDVLKSLPGEQRGIRRKGDTQVTEVNQGERSEVSVITCDAMDRDREIVIPEGIEYDDFFRYGTVLFGHDMAEPCGKCQWIKTRPDALLAKTTYPRKPGGYEGDKWLPDFVWSMISADILRGKSIGFIPLEYRDPTPEELTKYPEVVRVVQKSWLCEYSVVSAPCNPLALVESISKGTITLEALGWKVVGQVKPKQPAPVKKGDKLAAIRKGIEGVKIDYKSLVEAEFEKYRQRWEV